MTTGRKPDKLIRCGGVRAAIWVETSERKGDQVPDYTVQIDRTFKNKEGEFEHTNRYHARDLAKLRLVAAKADEFCNLKSEEPAEAPTEE